jgi:transcriptional regulator with XRE-family HTH domain
MAELAELAGTTPAVVSRIEHSQVSAGIDVISKLFKALGKKELNLALD